MLLTRTQAEILREAIRPLTTGMRMFCEKLYRVMYAFDVYPDLEYVHLRMDKDDVLIINHFVSAADGEEAMDLLVQTRHVLFELEEGVEAVVFASREDMDRIMSAELGDPWADKV